MGSQNRFVSFFRAMLFAGSILVATDFVEATAPGAPEAFESGIGAARAGSQRKVRDHLTEKEDELVREVQEIDKRIEVYIKAADRRLLVLINPNATQKKKEQEAWGPLPTGTKLELLQDYKRILEEAEEKLDDALNRDTKSPGLEKALSKFKDAAMRQIPQLRVISTQLTDKGEQRALAEAVEEAETVTKASGGQ